MKNILDEKPKEYEALRGRLRYSCDFVADEDIRTKKILDIGCGFGWFENYCLEKGANSITGIEYSEEDLNTSQNHITDPRAHFLVGSAIELPFEDESFDTVVSWEVLEHIPKKTERKMFEEVRRVLKPKGIFYLSTPFRSPTSTYFDPAWWLIDHRHYRRDQLAVFAHDLFDISEIRLGGSVWEVAGWWNLYVSKWIFRRPPFFQEWMDEQIDKEFNASEPKQFFATNLFAKFRPIPSDA